MKYELDPTPPTPAPQIKIVGIGEIGKNAIAQISKNIPFVDVSNIEFHHIDSFSNEQNIKVNPVKKNGVKENKLVIFLTDQVQKIEQIKKRNIYADHDYIVITSQTFDELKKISAYDSIISYCNAVIVQQEPNDLPLPLSPSDTDSTFFYWALRAIIDRLQSDTGYGIYYEHIDWMLFGNSPIFLSVATCNYLNYDENDYYNNAISVVSNSAISKIKKHKLLGSNMELTNILSTISFPSSYNYQCSDFDDFNRPMDELTFNSWHKSGIAIHSENKYSNSFIVFMLVSYGSGISKNNE